MDTGEHLHGDHAVINLIAVAWLSPKALALLKNYTAQRRQGLEPIFYETDLPDHHGVTAWDGTDEVDTPAFWEKRERKTRTDTFAEDVATESAGSHRRR